jgi:hypothetical protein
MGKKTKGQEVTDKKGDERKDGKGKERQRKTARKENEGNHERKGNV